MDWLESIKKYTPYNEQEKQDKEIIIKCLNMFDDLLTRDNQIVHVTSSGFVVNNDRDRVLMVHHNIFNSWSLIGGHADGKEDLLPVAIDEAQEETGVKNINPLNNDIFSLDILPVLGHIRKGEYVSSHLHISITYLFEADESDRLLIKADENSDVQWIPIREIESYSNEPHMKKVYKKMLAKIEALN
jgi:8-oxo-dGTP pyrophosphatase MutT (NUDIX family)